MINITSDQISKILNIAIASSKIKEIQLPHMKLRPFIHVLIWGDIGIGKSSILYNIGEIIGKTPIRSLTPASILGAADKNSGIATSPIIWDCRNSVVLIDEYHLDKFDRRGRDTLNDFLSVLENPKYTKKVGYRCNEINEEDGDLYLKIKDNTISCRSRFVMIMNTMMNMIDKEKMKELEALMSRCITVYLNFSFEELDQFSDGKPFYTYKEIKIKKEIVKINKKKYAQIKQFIKEKRPRKNRYLRLIGDLCRIYAVLGKIDKEIFDLIIELGE